MSALFRYETQSKCRDDYDYDVVVVVVVVVEGAPDWQKRPICQKLACVVIATATVVFANRALATVKQSLRQQDTGSGFGCNGPLWTKALMNNFCGSMLRGWRLVRIDRLIKEGNSKGKHQIWDGA